MAIPQNLSTLPVTTHITSNTSCNPCGSGDLRYHNGAVQTQPMAYLIFWGPSWKSSSGKLITPGQIVTKYFNDVSGTSYENILTQYYTQNPDTSQSYIPNTQQFNNTHTWIDTATPPSDHSCIISTIQDTSIQNEIKNAIKKKGWPSNEGNATYFVYTPSGYAVKNSTGCSNSLNLKYAFCGYHTIVPNIAVYAQIVYPSLACRVPNSPNGNNDGDSLTNITSHEQFEATTDPFPGLKVSGQTQDGWYDSTGTTNEIADKCNFNFQAGYTKLNNNDVFELQEMFSDATHSCVNTFTPHLTVNTTADFAPPCAIAAYSLRCAITQVNNDGSGKPIWFNIPSFNSGCKLSLVHGQNVYVCTITLNGDLPRLTASYITINGYTQPGSQKNTLSLGNGDNAILTIRIDGAGSANGLILTGNASFDTIQGLEITNSNYGILLFPNTVTNNSIIGNFVGTDGVNAQGNGTGIYIASGSSSNLIGGQTPDSTNLISGNSGQGVIIGAGNSNAVEGNYIGTDTSGSAMLHASRGTQGHSPLSGSGLPNGTGVLVFAGAINNAIGINIGNIISHNTYGIVTDGSTSTRITSNKVSSNYIGIKVENGEIEDSIVQNTIMNNGDAGILVGNSSADNVHVSISHNSIFNNGGLGIDLYPADTVNCNTSISNGPNDYLPCPIIKSATTTKVTGTAFPGSIIEIYSASNETDDQGYGEGFGFLGNVYADNNGNWSISLTLPAGEEITATATYQAMDSPFADTSEFAANVTVI